MFIFTLNLKRQDELKKLMTMEEKYFAESELIINPDGSVFHLHLKPKQLADKVILVGVPDRVP